MNKKGFTLIELLAVILVLGIIALIAIPVVNKVIDQAKKGAFERTVENIVKAVEEECQKDMLLGNTTAKTYTFVDGVATPTINVKGKLPKSGIIIVDNECNASTNNLTDGKYVATKLSTSNDLVITEVEPKLCQVKSGNGTQIGDEIKCGTESFYVIGEVEDNIEMLAKYNLKVGRIQTANSTFIEIDSNEEGYGLQNEEMIGAKSTAPFKGITVFSSESQKGTNYSSYEGSIVEIYVNDYAEKLNDMGLTVEEARLITFEEVEVLGCKAENEYDCRPEYNGTAPEWVYSTTYWTSTADNTWQNYVWGVYVGGYLNRNIYNFESYGVRPVITIPKSEI